MNGREREKKREFEREKKMTMGDDKMNVTVGNCCFTIINTVVVSIVDCYNDDSDG